MPSKRIIGSYVLDWIFVCAFAAAGGGLNYVKPIHRPFSLLDLDISFPFVTESISVTTLGLVALFAPAVAIAFVSLVLVPGPTFRRSLTTSQTIRRKLWELHSGLAGLALSVALGFFITQGLKNMFGKPRPHLIALCEPDLTDIRPHIVGGFGEDISVRWTLVNSTICTQKDALMLADGFRSFPSGHCSFSWSGLLYLSLFICSKFSIAVPFLPLQPASTTQLDEPRSADVELLPLHNPPTATAASVGTSSKAPAGPIQSSQPLPIYNQAASPPNYGLVLVLIPLAVATYISSTRYSEYWHFGFDVMAGSVIGILSAWFSFRWYHLPIQHGQGWAWGPRSRDRAFAIGVGVGSYVGPEGWETGNNARRDNGPAGA